MRWLVLGLVGLHTILLACLGFLPADAIPFQALLPNDKTLHLGGFLILTVLVFFVWELTPLIHIVALTALPVGTLAILSEIVQPLISPTRAFDGNDITANLIGTALGLLLALAVEYLRRKRALASLTPGGPDGGDHRGQYEAIEMEVDQNEPSAVAV